MDLEIIVNQWIELMKNEMENLVSIASKGYTKEQIIEYLHKKQDFSSTPKELIPTFDKLTEQLIDNIISIRLFLLQQEMRRQYPQIFEKEPYINKQTKNENGGKDFYREELERVKKDYIGDKVIKNRFGNFDSLECDSDKKNTGSPLKIK